MYSQCPDCQTRFRVTADVLRLAHGTVRCGRCGSAFDALARLSDTLPPRGQTSSGPRLAGAAASLRPAGEPASAAEFHFSADDLEHVFVDERDWQRQYGPPGAAAATPESLLATNEPSELLVDEGEPLEDITLEGERIQIELPPGFLEDDEDRDEAGAAAGHEASVDLEATDRFKALDLHAGLAAPAGEPADPQAAADRERTMSFKVTDDLRAQAAAAAGTQAPTVVPIQPTRWREPAPAIAPRSVESIAPRRWQPPPRVEEADLPLGGDADDESGSRRGRLAWTLGCLVLALALLAQLTHYFRQDLVRHPQIGPALGSVYERLGLDLAPNWDPRAFEIRQWGDAGASARDGRMNVQASLRNTAAFAQPFPLLRLELEDRFGSPVATRDFEPAEYLKVPALATRLLAPGASADTDLEIVDPGTDAVGYRLDVCLRESAEILRCAQGPG